VRNGHDPHGFKMIIMTNKIYSSKYEFQGLLAIRIANAPYWPDVFSQDSPISDSSLLMGPGPLLLEIERPPDGRRGAEKGP